jgi:hypothetical protein
MDCEPLMHEKLLNDTSEAVTLLAVVPSLSQQSAGADGPPPPLPLPPLPPLTPDAPVQQSVGLVRQNLKAPTVASKSVSVRFCTVMPVTTGIEFMVVNIGHTSST